jgi:predicted DNA-binding ribbon-helix-helix protein
MNSTVKKRSIVIGGRKTSISLEDDFWMSLRQIARGRQVTTSDLITSLDAARENSNLSSAIRVFILDHYRAMWQSDVGFKPLGSIPRAAVNPTAMALTSHPPAAASPPASGCKS